MCDLNSDINVFTYLWITVFWDSRSSLFYLKYVGRTIPLFLSFLFFCNYIFIRIKLKLHIWLAWVNLQNFWSQKNFSKVNITPNKHKKPFFKVLFSRLVNFKIRCISPMKGVLFHRKAKKTWTAFMKKHLCLTDMSDR